MIKVSSSSRAFRWVSAVAASVLSCYFLTGMEWLFFATQPSFLSPLSISAKSSVLLLAPLPLVVPSLGLGLALWLAGLTGRRVDDWCLRVFLVIPALISGITLSLLVDNFSLTVVGYGIRSTRGHWIHLYYLVPLLLAVVSWIFWNRRVRQPSRAFVLISTTLLLAAAVVSTVSSIGRSDRQQLQVESGTGTLPNILLFSSDGLNAANLSAYGYGRDTTPYLASVKDQALIVENGFTNAAQTGGSIAALLTGRLPTTTRLVYPPDILRGEDAYLHLPIMLRRLNYHSIHLSMRHYADAFDLNLQESFDSSNSRDFVEVPQLPRLKEFLGSETGYLWALITDRLWSRFLHLAEIQLIEDVYADLVLPKQLYQRDTTLMKTISEYLEETPEPFFAQVHLIGTHGPRFRPSQLFYSHAQEQNATYMIDFYDDAIRDFDRYFERLMERLRELELLDHTIVVVTSDHGISNHADYRVPLLFFFPGSQHHGTIRENAQLVDIAPTLLDYLGIDVPSWMEGQSLLTRDLDPRRPVFAVKRGMTPMVRQDNVWQVDYSRVSPPFFSMGRLLMTYCQQTHELDLKTMTLRVARLPDHTAPCPIEELPSRQEAIAMMKAHLASRQYDVSSIPDSLP